MIQWAVKHIRLVSDLHLDFDIRAAHGTRLADPAFDAYVQQEGEMAFLWHPPLMVGDDETTLVIAGDIWDDRKFLRRKFSNGESWIQRIAKRFKYVVFVLGNHDYWGTNISIEDEKIREDLKLVCPNVFLLERDSIVLDQVKFLGGVLWTDYDNEDAHAMIVAPMVMANDHQKIRHGEHYGKLRVEHLLGIHKKTKKFIFENAQKDSPDQRVVVVTHMAPSFQSIHPMWKGARTNCYYYSDMELELCYEKHDIELWFHGHTHMPMDYVLHDRTRVVCNPRGYRGYEQTGFNPQLRFDV